MGKSTCRTFYLLLLNCYGIDLSYGENVRDTFRDALTNQYILESGVFVDTFNCLIYDRKPVIQPDELNDIDTTGYATPHRAGEKEKTGSQKI